MKVGVARGWRRDGDEGEVWRREEWGDIQGGLMHSSRTLRMVISSALKLPNYDTGSSDPISNMYKEIRRKVPDDRAQDLRNSATTNDAAS